MKAYKIDLSGFTGKVREVVSEAVQKKAFELGYGWKVHGKTITHLGAPIVYCESNGGMMKDNDTSAYADDLNTAITADAFLALESEEPEFKPFDKVLMRDEMHGQDDWTLCQYSHFWEETDKYVAMGGLRYDFCIHYEGNEHLLGTTNKE